jgi:SAM-dependent methyltransferase
MAEPQIRYDDGAAYERYMGQWTRPAGEHFLQWLKPRPGLRWIDVGCGTGAFTELIVQRCAPSEIQGIDPSEAQLAFARTRAAMPMVTFRPGDAMAIPFPDKSFDVAVMALVIFFVPDPATGVAEMKRVVRPGGTLTAYAWDILGGGFPWDPVQAEMRAMGLTPVLPPSAEASRLQRLRELWTAAGLDAVETTEIPAQRTFASFDDFWTTALLAASIRPMVAAMAAKDVELLRRGVAARLPADSAGRITYGARANAVKGRVPG